MAWVIVSNILGILVLLPALVLFLWRLERPLGQTRKHLRAIVSECDNIAGTLDGIPRLAETKMITGSGQPGVERYAEALAGRS